MSVGHSSKETAGDVAAAAVVAVDVESRLVLTDSPRLVAQHHWKFCV